MRASSWNQISTGLRSATSARWALSVVAKFFERRDRPGVLRRMARARADVGEAEGVEDLADRPLVIRDPETLGDEPLEVDPPPTHHAVHGRVRTSLDDLLQFGELRGGQPRARTWRREARPGRAC